MGKRSHSTHQDPLPQNPMPASSEDVVLDGIEYTAIKEGLATVLFPKKTFKTDKHGREVEIAGGVFYNPIQQFNRDLSVLAVKTFSEIYSAEKQAKAEKKKDRDKYVRGQKLEKHIRSNGGELANTGSTETAGDTAIGPADNPRPESSVEIQENMASARPTTKLKPSFHSKFSVLDALSATGLRALRYTLEIPIVTSATANDLDASATDSIRRNIEFNKRHSVSCNPDRLSAPDAVSKIHVNLGNAQHHMYSVICSRASRQGRNFESDTSDARHRTPPVDRYEVIDLDPYGTAVPFLDAAVQAISDGGLLCVTCTDAGVWASKGYSEKCYSLYGGVPVKGDWCHEAGLRLILHSIATAGAKYGLYIEPLLSLSIDFYARVWVRIRHGPAEVKKLASSTMVVYNCDEGCGSWVEQRVGRAKESVDKSGSGIFLKFGLARAPTTGENCTQCGSVMHVSDRCQSARSFFTDIVYVAWWSDVGGLSALCGFRRAVPSRIGIARC
jgi:tRNA (guanine26-N2/guanine27-N2)-dimethyltransferase